MSATETLSLAATALLGAGMWLVLPRGGARGRRLGGVLAAAGLALFGSKVWVSDAWAADGVFALLAAVTLASALAAISMPSPVYSAIWFGLTLLGTAGLFLFQGAQFLGVATVVVYAGAILVTFLFVLMLAQPRGLAYYDRVSWEGLLSACTGAVLVGMLTTAIFVGPGPAGRKAAAVTTDRVAPGDREKEILHPHHMARLGSQLFSRHLIAVEVAGTLLLVALVGAVAIVAQGKPPGSGTGERRHG